MADRKGGGSAGAHQAALAAAALQQLLNGAAAAGLSNGRVPPPSGLEVGTLPPAAVSGSASQAVFSQRYQFGSAGRAALHIARQARPEQFQLTGDMDVQLAQLYQLGLADTVVQPYGIINAVQTQQQQLLQQQQHQQHHLLQQRHIAGSMAAVMGPSRQLPSQRVLVARGPNAHGSAQDVAAHHALLRPAATPLTTAAGLQVNPNITAATIAAAVAAAGAADDNAAAAAATTVAAFRSGPQLNVVANGAPHVVAQVVAANAAEQQAIHHPNHHQQQQQEQQQLQYHQLQLQWRQTQIQQMQLPQHQVQLQQQQHLQQQHYVVGAATGAVQGQGAGHPSQQYFLQQQHQQLLQRDLLGFAQQPVAAAQLQQQQLVIQQLQHQQQLQQQQQLLLQQLQLQQQQQQQWLQLQQQQQQQHRSRSLVTHAPPSPAAIVAVAAAVAQLNPSFSLTAAAHSTHPIATANRRRDGASAVRHDADPQYVNGCSPAASILGDGDAECTADSDVSDDYVSPNHPICDTASSWTSLTSALLARVMGLLAECGALPGAAPGLRRVCHHWRAVVDAHLDGLSPQVMKVRAITTRFSSLRSLHLEACANIRNRDLLVLTRGPAAPPLTTLTLGDDRTRPWVSNRGLASLCRLTTLTRVTLRDCNSLTNRGLVPLSALSRLTCLSLRGCRKLTNQGLEALRPLVRLQHLSLYGVVRVSDKGMLPLADLPALESLELGHTRCRDEGLGHLVGKLGRLRALVLVREEVSDAGVRQLSSLTGLSRLVLRDCVEVSGETLAALLPSLRGLQLLDLQRNWAFNNMQLARCLPALVSAPALTALDLRATWVAEEGVVALARLTALRRLAISPQPDQWPRYLPALPQLQQLTALTLRNLHTLPYQLLEALTALTGLLDLDLAEPYVQVAAAGGGSGAGGGVAVREEGGGGAGGGMVGGVGGRAAMAAAVAAAVVAKETLRPQAVAALSKLRNVERLDLSRRNLSPDQALFLATHMPSLTRLVLLQCPLPQPALAALWRQRPTLLLLTGPGGGPGGGGQALLSRLVGPGAAACPLLLDDPDGGLAL